jgi:hypothetical protein
MRQENGTIIYYAYILSEDVKQALQQSRPYYLTGPIITPLLMQPIADKGLLR